MIFSKKDYRWGIGFIKHGPEAYKVSYVYKPGIHFWANEEEGAFNIAIVFWKTRSFRLSFPYKKPRGACQG